MSKTYWLSSPETSDLFERLVLDVFESMFQTYHFVVHKADKDGYGCRVTVCNSTTGIQFNYEPGSLRIWTIVYKLIDGRLPEYQITPIPGHKSDYFYLEDLMVAKDPAVQSLRIYVTGGQIEMNVPITEEYLREKLDGIQKCLIKYMQEILSGDFTLFNKAQKILDARVHQASSQ
jgi:hypothetical protein